MEYFPEKNRRIKMTPYVFLDVCYYQLNEITSY